MLDVLDLEKRWSRYRLKKSLPLIISSTILFILAGTVYYFSLMNPALLRNILESDKSLPEEKTIAEVIQPSPEANHSTMIAAVEAPLDDGQNILKPSFNFMYNIEDQLISYNNTKFQESFAKEDNKKEKEDTVSTAKAKSASRSTIIKPKKTERPKKVAKAEKKTPVKEKAPIEKRAVETELVKTVVIKNTEPAVQKEEPKEVLVQILHDQTTEDELQSVITRFHKYKKPALSLFIAKKYYELGDYQEAYNYALETNKLNPDIEDSILIFCRSMAKLGKTADAIATLKAYSERSGSIEAKVLLDEIQKGNFK